MIYSTFQNLFIADSISMFWKNLKTSNKINIYIISWHVYVFIYTIILYFLLYFVLKATIIVTWSFISRDLFSKYWVGVTKLKWWTLFQK